MQKLGHGHKLVACLLMMAFMFSAFMLSGCGSVAEKAVTWTLVDPSGVQKMETIELNPHPTSLEGKTVVLRWNGKENGDNLLDGVAEQLEKHIKDVKVIKLYETMPETTKYGVDKMGDDIIKEIAALEPDLIISGQAD